MSEIGWTEWQLRERRVLAGGMDNGTTLVKYLIAPEGATFFEISQHLADTVNQDRHSLEQQLAEVKAELEAAKERNPELGYGYWAQNGTLSQGDGLSDVMLYKTDEQASEIYKLKEAIQELVDGDNEMYFDEELQIIDGHYSKSSKFAAILKKYDIHRKHE